MLGSPGDGPLLLVNDTDGEGPELFDTREEAEVAGKADGLGMIVGFIIYEWPGKDVQ